MYILCTIMYIWFTQESFDSQMEHFYCFFMYILCTIMYIWFTQNNQSFDSLKRVICFSNRTLLVFLCTFYVQLCTFDSLKSVSLWFTQKSKWFINGTCYYFFMYILCTIMYIWFTQKRQSFDSLKRVIWFINGALLLFLIHLPSRARASVNIFSE